MDERDQDNEDKTEDPTEERRRQFREEGKLPATREILSAFSLIFITAVMYFFGTQILSSVSQIFQSTWSLIPAILRNERPVQLDIYAALTPLILPVSLAGLTVVIAPSVVGLLLGRFNWSWKKVEFDIKKLNPVSGITNIYGKQIIFETTKSIVKAVLILWVAYLIVLPEFMKSPGYLFSEPITGLVEAGGGIMRLMIFVCIATLVIGAADFSYNIYKMETELRMTKQQVKDEIKKQEGDPLYKFQRRRFARDTLLRSSIDKVATATFVVTNPTHYSVAIRYSAELPAPIVVSKGQDYLALRIRQIATSSDIMIIENKILARALYKTVEIGDEVPSSLYLAVIEVLKSIYRSRGKGYFERFGIVHQFS